MLTAVCSLQTASDAAVERWLNASRRYLGGA
jgi:hypothetical protein